MKNQSHHIKHTPLAKPAWENTIPEINGLILAGGKSTRMGIDKSAIDYHGVPQSDYLFQLLKSFLSIVYLSYRPDHIPETHHQIIKDTFLDLGPYGAVLSAFRFNPNCAWLVVACDIPLIDESTISNLIEQRDQDKIATCFHDPSTGKPEPLITIWEPRAYPVLLHHLSQGVSCLRTVLIDTDAKQIDAINPHVLRNANTPEESNLFQQLLPRNSS